MDSLWPPPRSLREDAVEPATPLSDDELVEQLTEGSNESMSSVLAVLSAMDRAMEQALKAGRIVKLPSMKSF